MNLNLFKQLADAMLVKHFGISINDTWMGNDEASFSAGVKSGAVRPFAAVNEAAEDCDLVRIDVPGPWGVPTYKPLTRTEELAALAGLGEIGIGEEPMLCPCCQHRTDLEELAGENSGAARQHHSCSACGHEFIASETNFRNYYMCPCGEEWADDWTAACNDHCPACEKEIEPFISDDGSVSEEQIDAARNRVLFSRQVADGKLDDRYADSIIGNRVRDYNAVEIHGVRDLHPMDDPRGTCCEVDDENPEFFSVYAHCVEGGIECIGDFSVPAKALSYADEIAFRYGWPVYNHLCIKEAA